MLEALVAEVTSGHVHATSDVQVVHCHSLHRVLLLLTPFLSQAVLAVGVWVVRHEVLLHHLLVCHLFGLIFLFRIVLILIDPWELIGHSHTIVAVDVTLVPLYAVRVDKLLLLELLLLCKLRLELLLAFNELLLLNFGCCFLVQIILNWVLSDELLVGFGQLPSIIDNIFDFVKVSPQIL